MSGPSVTTQLFRRLLTLGFVYAVLQLVVGVQVSFVIVYLHFAKGMSIVGATATATPIGLPLLLGQGALYLAWRSGRLGRLFELLKPAPAHS